MNKEQTLEILKLYKLIGYKDLSCNTSKGLYNLVKEDSIKQQKQVVATNSKVNKIISSSNSNKLQEEKRKQPSQKQDTQQDKNIKLYNKLQKITNLEDLKKEVLAFDGCALKKTANSTVFGHGNATSNILLLGEGPGADEDKQGKPFVGRSGQLLTMVLESIGIQRDDIFITNTVFWRPPGNRAPTNQEMQLCMPFVHRIIELVDPKIIIALGSSSYKFLSNEANPRITKERGKIKTTCLNSGKEFKYIPTFHPAYLLRSPLQKKAVWEDMLTIKNNFL